jgi:hypothetical protein
MARSEGMSLQRRLKEAEAKTPKADGAGLQG